MGWHRHPSKFPDSIFCNQYRSELSHSFSNDNYVETTWAIRTSNRACFQHLLEMYSNLLNERRWYVRLFKWLLILVVPGVFRVILGLYIQDLLMIWRIHVATFLRTEIHHAFTQWRVWCHSSPLHPNMTSQSQLFVC